MSCVRSSLLVLFVCAVSRAETVVILQGGKAWLLPDGSSVGIPIAIVRLPGDGPGPIPPNPDPPNEGELEQLSSDWVSKVMPYSKRAHHRQGLQATYSVLGKQAADGEFSSLAELQERTKATYNLLLGVVSPAETSVDKERWREWFKPIEVYLGANVRSVEQAVPAYSEITAGLEVPGDAIGPGWVAFIKFVINLLGQGDISPVMIELIQAILNALSRGVQFEEIMQALAGGST